MMYRFKDFLGRDHSRQAGSEVMLYRGVPRSLTERDLALGRWHFSRAIDHNKGAREAELFRTDEEVNRELKLLGLGDPDQWAMSLVSRKFFGDADRHFTGQAFVNAWSYERSAALEFPYGWPLDDRAIVCVTESGLVKSFLDCLARWNAKQCGAHEIAWPDGRLRDDWEPRSIKYAFGKIDYRDRSACTLEAPFRIGRAMRLPRGCQDGDLQEEAEWRIALDISDVPSPFSAGILGQSELFPRAMGSLSALGDYEALEPAISLNGAIGLWLNDFKLAEASGFRFDIA